MKLLAIYLKEMTDTLRDRRSLFSALSYGLFGPLAVVFTVNVLAAATRPTALEPVAVCSGDAPALVEHLHRCRLDVRSGAPVSACTCPTDYAAAWPPAQTANVRSARRPRRERRDGRQAANRDSALRADAWRTQRALARGIATAVLAPITVDRAEHSTPSRGAPMSSRAC